MALWQPSTLARYLFVAYVPLVVYASLHPFSGWRDRGLPPFAFLTAPFSRPILVFDVVANIIGYMPLGFLAVLAVYPWLRRSYAFGFGLACSVILSFALESLQLYLPTRASSNLDLLANTVGGAAGALRPRHDSPFDGRRGTAAPAQQTVPSGAPDRSRAGAARAVAIRAAQSRNAALWHRGSARFIQDTLGQALPRRGIPARAGRSRLRQRPGGGIARFMPHRAQPAGAGSGRDLSGRGAGRAHVRIRTARQLPGHPLLGDARSPLWRGCSNPAAARCRRDATHRAACAHGLCTDGGDGPRQSRPRQSLHDGLFRALATGAFSQFQRRHPRRFRRVAVRGDGLSGAARRRPRTAEGVGSTPEDTRASQYNCRDALHIRIRNELLRKTRFFLLQPAPERRDLLQRQRRKRHARLREKTGQGTGPRRSREGARESGGVPGPLRGRALRRGVPGGGLVHLRRPRRYRRDHRGARQGRPGGRTPAHMSGAGERIFIDGGAGRIETVVDGPESAPRGMALVAHPHPLYGGTLDNKVVQTLARTLVG